MSTHWTRRQFLAHMGAAAAAISPPDPAALMTSQTPEGSAMADGAPGLIYRGLGVGVVELRYMIGRLEISGLGVALLATERNFDLVVAHEAVRHLGHVGVTNLHRRIDPPVTCQARIRRRVQVRPNIIRIAEVRLLVDRRRDHRR